MSHFFTVYKVSCAVVGGNIPPSGEYSGTVKKWPIVNDCSPLHRR